MKQNQEREDLLDTKYLKMYMNIFTLTFKRKELRLSRFLKIVISNIPRMQPINIEPTTTDLSPLIKSYVLPVEG